MFLNIRNLTGKTKTIEVDTIEKKLNKKLDQMTGLEFVCCLTALASEQFGYPAAKLIAEGKYLNEALQKDTSGCDIRRYLSLLACIHIVNNAKCITEDKNTPKEGESAAAAPAGPAP